MKIVSVIARYLLGLMFTVFGLNGFLNFIHQPPPANPLALQFFVAIIAIAFAAVLLRGAAAWRAAVAFRLLCAARAHAACGGALQHSCLPPHAIARHRSGAGGLRVVGAGLRPIPRKLQGHSCREACIAAIILSRQRGSTALFAAKRARGGKRLPPEKTEASLLSLPAVHQPTAISRVFGLEQPMSAEYPPASLYGKAYCCMLIAWASIH